MPIGLLSLFLTSRLVSDPPAFKAEVAEAKRLGKLKIDYIGISLIALGFAFLEVVLDRGQIDDWLGSRFITSMLIAAVACLAFAIWWELRAPDPVVELGLLRERNFAISNIFYFLFGFVLFGSTTMIPEILQSLYGYTATDAGLVLGPGAAVITVLAPMVAVLTQKGVVKPRWLIAFSFAVVSASMFYYGSFNPQTDYLHYALARALQGFGYAFLFVPGECTGLLLFASGQEQQRLEPDEPRAQLGWQLRGRVHHHHARAPRRRAQRSPLTDCRPCVSALSSAHRLAHQDL